MQLDSNTIGSTYARYVYTVSCKDINAPTGFIFRGKDHEAKMWQTADLGGSLLKGRTYTFSDYSEINSSGSLTLKVYKGFLKGRDSDNDLHFLAGNVRAYIYDSENNKYQSWGTETIMNSGSDSGGNYWSISIPSSSLSSLNGDLRVIFHSDKGSNNTDLSGSWSRDHQTPAYRISKNKSITFKNQVTQGDPDTADAIYSCLYTNPLYFGCFWRSNSADTIANNSNNPGYNISNKAAYNNFWWQANIGLKNTGTTANDDPSETDTTGFRVRGTASTQGLVHSSLVNDNLADPVNTTTELPYFDKTSSLVTDGLMKYYDKDETGDDIQFPFYEVKSDVNSSSKFGDTKTKIAGSYVAPTAQSPVTQYAKFYQFDSKESNVRFEIAQNESNVEDPSLHKGHFVETSQAITHDGKAGYFPFNNINNTSFQVFEKKKCL